MIDGCFLAIPLPDEQIELFHRLIDELKELHPPIRFQKADTPHLTMIYFGRVHEEKLQKIQNKASELTQSIRPFDLTIKGTGYFGSDRYPRVAWLGTESSPQLHDLQTRIAAELGCYCQKNDKRPYHAHLTIARISSAKKFSPLQPEFKAICERYQFNFKADRLRLYIARPEQDQRQIPLTDHTFSK